MTDKKPAKLKWETVKRKIHELVPYEFNPRSIHGTQVENLKKSLEEFDLVEIPAINVDNTILAGHQRLAVMKMLGRGGEEIDVRMPNRALTQNEFKKYNVLSNAIDGAWDWDALANNLDENALKDWGFESLQLRLEGELPDLGGQSPEMGSGGGEGGSGGGKKMITCPDCGHEFEYNGKTKD